MQVDDFAVMRAAREEKLRLTRERAEKAGA